MIHIFFGSSFGVRYNCAKFHYCRICATDFSEGGLFAPPHPRAARKKPILYRVNKFDGSQSATLLENTLWQRCFAVNLAQVLRAPVLKNIWERLLLFMATYYPDFMIVILI